MPFCPMLSVRLRRACLLGLAALAGSGAWAAAQAEGDPAPATPAECLGPAGKAWVKVVVENVRSARGQIALTIYPDDPGRFLIHNGSLYVVRAKAVAGTTSSCVFVPKPGVYVIAVYHDENGNGLFDRNSLGLPTEAYGFSNNPPTLLGLPSFRSVRLNLAHSGLTAHIRLTYP